MAILGKKIGMTRVYLDSGESVAVTVIEAGPCVVVQKKTQEKDGYTAIQLGFNKDRQRTGKKRHWPTKPLAGHFKKANVEPHRVLREFRLDDVDAFEVGQTITLEGFEVGQHIDVRSRSKGKGFQGVIKRHGFAGGKASHGAQSQQRAGGSIGMSADPSRVLPGTKMPGRMGNAMTTVRNLEIIEVDVEKNLLLVRGAVPGAKRAVVEIRPTNMVGK